MLEDKDVRPTMLLSSDLRQSLFQKKMVNGKIFLDSSDFRLAEETLCCRENSQKFHRMSWKSWQIFIILCDVV